MAKTDLDEWEETVNDVVYDTFGITTEEHSECTENTNSCQPEQVPDTSPFFDTAPMRSHDQGTIIAVVRNWIVTTDIETVNVIDREALHQHRGVEPSNP